jgi:hypothetical protein
MLADIALFVVGFALVLGIVLSALSTVVLPHGRSTRLTKGVFRATRHAAKAYGRLDPSPRRQHTATQMSVACGLLLLPMIWLGVTMVGYMCMFKSFGSPTWRSAYDIAGSSMLTLGFAKENGLPTLTLSFTAAALTIAILALLLVTYLPTIYQAYVSREVGLTAFETVAGEPPNVTAMLIRLHRIGGLERPNRVWVGSRVWFAELRESHTALPAVAFLGSSRDDRSWVATVGTMLDAASLSLAVIDSPGDPDAALCIRAGSLALRDIAAYFGVDVDHDPSQDAPISVSREQFDRVYDQLEAEGVPIRARDESWTAWAGWRVNYDAALVGLGRLTMTPTMRLTADDVAL